MPGPGRLVRAGVGQRLALQVAGVVGRVGAVHHDLTQADEAAQIALLREVDAEGEAAEDQAEEEDVGARVVVPEGLLVGVGVDLDATASTSVAAFENFTNLLLQPIGENLGALVQPVTLPQFSYVRYSDPAVEIVGPNKHHLSVELRLHPAVTP